MLCAVLCAVLCCAVLCCAVLCCAVLCCAVAQAVAPRKVYSSLNPAAIHCRYCQDVSSKRVPEADFVEELLKGLALLSISPKQKQSGDRALLKGITWAQVSCKDPNVLTVITASLHCPCMVLTLSSQTVITVSLHYADNATSLSFHHPYTDLTLFLHCPQDCYCTVWQLPLQSACLLFSLGASSSVFQCHLSSV